MQSTSCAEASADSLGRMFDHVAIAVSDLAASERFYCTVLNVLGTEPSHADAELVDWADWDIGQTDPEHPLTRGLHVGLRDRNRAPVEAFWQAGACRKLPISWHAMADIVPPTGVLPRQPIMPARACRRPRPKARKT